MIPSNCLWCGEDGLLSHRECDLGRLRAFAKASFAEAQRLEEKGDKDLSTFYSGKGLGLLQAIEILGAS